GLRPGLDALETLMNDWRMAGYAERSAYQVMNAMTGRTARHHDYLDAMIGAITSAPSIDPNDAELSRPEYFMRACERKGDFSFIYSTASRASGAWRPSPSSSPGPLPLPPVLPWTNTGERQTGALRAGSLHLHNMARVSLGRLDEAARGFIH